MTLLALYMIVKNVLSIDMGRNATVHIVRKYMYSHYNWFTPQLLHTYKNMLWQYFKKPCHYCKTYFTLKTYFILHLMFKSCWKNSFHKQIRPLSHIMIKKFDCCFRKIVVFFVFGLCVLVNRYLGWSNLSWRLTEFWFSMA